ncbi:MAG: hypothetical protein V2A74_03540 [bacterium]
MQLLSASVIALATAVNESANATELTAEEKTLWLVILAGVVVLFILIGFFLIRRKLDDTRGDEALAEAEFERRMLDFLDRGAAAGLAQPAPQPPQPPLAPDAPAAERPAYSPLPSTPLAPSTAAPDSSSDPIAPILERLRSSGLYQSSEGSVPLGDGFMRAQRVRLRGGKTALILPYLETDFFLSRQIKPHDYLIIRLHNGEVLVARKWGDFITDSMKLD